jgi:hypothetical protein
VYVDLSENVHNAENTVVAYIKTENNTTGYRLVVESTDANDDNLQYRMKETDYSATAGDLILMNYGTLSNGILIPSPDSEVPQPVQSLGTNIPKISIAPIAPL